MRAIRIKQPGGPEVLETCELPALPISPHEVRVRVRATALNRADLLQRRGLYPAPPGALQDVPGLEFAGEVIELGDRVEGLRVGDRVMGILGGGGYSDEITIHERLCLRIPPNMSFTEAAGVPEAFLTAFDALILQGGLIPGEVVLIHAAGSGIGTAAFQIASVSGAFCVGTTRSEAKRARLESSGFEHVTHPDAGDAVDRLRDLTRGRGVHLVLDLIGASAWELNARLLRRRGRWVLIGLLGGRKVEIDLAVLLSKRITLIGSVLRSRPLEEKISLVQEFRERMLPLLASGRIEPVIDSVFPWEDVGAAHRAMESNLNFGKIVLEVGDSSS